MEKIRRNERMSAMMKMLSDTPNRIFTLSTFCEKFNAAKSTMSEDIDLLQKVVADFGLGELETVTGAAGGVRWRAKIRPENALRTVEGMCSMLSGSERVLPGGYIYYSDILSDPVLVRQMGEIAATRYFDAKPDFVLTMETKGIPVALETARALSVPLVIARRSSKVYEGPAVNINYVSGSSGTIQTMSLSRRAVKSGQRCLIVDDFLKAGGTARGMIDLMNEFDVTVVGSVFVMSTMTPEKKRVEGTRSLMVLRMENDEAVVTPADWLIEEAHG